MRGDQLFGRVVTSTGDPIKNVSLKLEGAGDAGSLKGKTLVRWTRADGTFSFAGIPKGATSLHVSAAGLPQRTLKGEELRSALASGEPLEIVLGVCLLYTSPSPRDKRQSRMPSSA